MDFAIFLILSHLQNPFVPREGPSAKEISKAQNPKGFMQSAAVARKGGQIAGDARMKLEAQTGRSVISSEKASDYLLLENTDDENDK